MDEILNLIDELIAAAHKYKEWEMIYQRQPSAEHFEKLKRVKAKEAKKRKQLIEFVELL